MNDQKYINTLIEMNKILEPHEIHFNLNDYTKIIRFIEIIRKSQNSNLQLTSLNIFKNNSNNIVYKDKDFILLNNISTEYMIYITMILFMTSDDPFPYIKSTIVKLLYTLNFMININSSVNEELFDFSKIMIYLSYISFFKDIKKTIDTIDEYNLYNKKLLEKETFVIKNQYTYQIIIDILMNLYMILKISFNNTNQSRLVIYLIDMINKFFLFFIDYVIFTYQNIIFLQKDCIFFNFILLSFDFSSLIENLKIKFKNELVIFAKIDIFEECLIKIHYEYISYIENNSFLSFLYDDYVNILSNKEIILPLFCKSYPEDYINNNSLSKKINYLVWILNKFHENSNGYNYKNKYYDRLEECFSFNPEYPNRTYIGKEIFVEYINKDIYNTQILEYQSYISIGYKKYKPSLFYPPTGYSIIFSFNFFPIKKYCHNSNKGYSYNEKVVTSNIVEYLYKTNNNKENNRSYCLFSLYNKENNIVNLSLFINSNNLLCIDINSKFYELRDFNLIERKNYFCWIHHYSNNTLSININDYSEVVKADYPYNKSFEILIGAQVCLNKKRHSENSNVTFDPNPNVVSANQINNYFSGEIGTVLIYNTTANISNAIISSIIKNIDKTEYENIITKSLSNKLLSNINDSNIDYEIESLSIFLQMKGIKQIKEKDHINIVNLLKSLSKSNFLIMICSTKGVNKEFYSNYYNIGFSSIFDSYRSNFFSEEEYFIDFNKINNDSVYNIGYTSSLYINEFHDHNIINKDFLKKFYSNDSILRRNIIINNIYIKNFEIKDKKYQKLIEYTNELYLYSNQQSIQVRKYLPFSKYIGDNLYIVINLLNEKFEKKNKDIRKFDNHKENSIKLVNFTELLYNYKKLTIEDYTILQTYIISVLEESYFNIDLLLITQYFLSITNIKYYELNNHSFYTIDMIQNNIRLFFLIDNWIELLNQIIKSLYSDKNYGTSSNTNTGNFSNYSNFSYNKNINDRNQQLIQMNLYINIFNNGEISLSSKNNLQYFIHYFYYQRSNLFYNIFNYSLYINPDFSYYSYVYQITNMGLSCVNDEYFLINSKNFGQVLSFIYFIADDNYKINSEEYYTEFTIKFNSLIKEFISISITKKDSSIFNVFINFFWINKNNNKILFYSLQSFFFIEGLYANIISQNFICVEDFIEILINLLLYISENNENNINDNYFNNLSIGIILQILDLAYFKNRNINIKILFTNKSPKQNNNKRSLSILNAYYSFSKNNNQIIIPTVSSKNLNTIINSDKNLYKSNINVFKNIVRRHSRYKNMSSDLIRKNMKSKLKFSYKIISKDEYDNKLTLYSNLINYYIESENIYALRSLFLYCFNLKTKKKQSIEFIKLDSIKNLKLKLHTRSKKYLNIFVNSYERKIVSLKEKNNSKSTKFFEGTYFLFESLIQSCIRFTKTNFEIKNSLYSLYENSKYSISFDDSFFSDDDSDIDSVCSSSYKNNMNIRRYSNESFKSNQSNISNIDSNIKKTKSVYNSSIISLIIDDNESKQLLYEIISSKYIFNKIFFLTLDNYKKNTDLYRRTINHIYDSIFFLTFDNMKPFYYDLIFLLFINKLLSYDILLFLFEAIISRIRYTYEDNLNVITCDIIYNIKKILTLYFKSINYIYFNSNSYILIKEDKINEIRKTININKEARKMNEIQKIDEDDSNSFDESKSNSKYKDKIQFENVISYHSPNKSNLSISKNKEDNVSIKKKVNKELKKSIKSFIENKKFIKTFTDILYLVINSNIHLMSNISFYINESNLSYNETFKKTFIELLFEICLSLFKITGNNIYIELFLDEIERKKNSKIQNGTVVIFADLFTETEKLYSQAFSIIKPTNNMMLERLNYIGMDLKSKSNDYFIGNQYLLSENLVSICLREYIEVSKIFLNDVNIENILKRKLYFPFLSEEISEIEYLGVYDDLLDDDIKSSREYKDHLSIIKESKTSDKTVSFIRKLDKNIKTLIKILSKIIELSTNDLFKIKVIKEYINNKNIKNTKEIKKQKTILSDNKISNTTSNNPFLVVLNEIIIEKYTKIRNEGKIESIIKNIDIIYINWSELINEFFDKLNIYFKNQNELDLLIYNYNHQFSTILDFYYIINDYDLLTYYKYKHEISSLYIDQLLYNNTEEVNTNYENFGKDSNEKIIFLKNKNYLNVLNLIEKLVNKENTDDYLFMKKEYNKKNIEKENFSKTECKFYIFLNKIQSTLNQNLIYYKINIDKNQKIKSILDKKYSIVECEQYINNNEKSGELENSIKTSNKSLISVYDYPFLSKEEEKIYAENFYYLHNKVVNIPEYLQFHIENNFKSLIYQKDMLIKTALSNEEISKVVNRELINITNSYLINQTPQNQNEEYSYYNNSNISVIEILNDNLYNIKYLMDIFIKLNNKIEIKSKNESETTAKISLSYKRKDRRSRLSIKKNLIFDFDNNVLLNELIENTINKDKFECELITLEGFYYVNLYIISSYIKINFEVPPNNYIKKTQKYLISSHENDMNKTFQINKLAKNIMEVLYNDNRKVYLSGDYLKRESIIININDIKEVIIKEFCNFNQSIEIYFKYSLYSDSILLNFFNEDSCNKFILQLENNKILFKKDIIIKKPIETFISRKYMSDWSEFIISNHDYILLLNKYSSRSIHNPYQYYIFPWTIIEFNESIIDLDSDKIYRDFNYPMTAQYESNKERIISKYNEMLNENNEESNDDNNNDNIEPYQQFSNYSTSAYICYYLMRIPPYTNIMIKLQNDKFDNPNRMFFSIKETKHIVCNYDNRELISEIFLLPEMLLNINKYSFGIRSNKKLVDHVNLPLWSNNSPYVFVEHMKKSLESKYVNTYLHNWIDIIFGNLQRNEKNFTIFSKLNYSNEFKELYISQSNLKDRKSLLDNIINFGMFPSKLYKNSHIERENNRLFSSKEIKLYEDFLIFLNNQIQLNIGRRSNLIKKKKVLFINYSENYLYVLISSTKDFVEIEVEIYSNIFCKDRELSFELYDFPLKIKKLSSNYHIHEKQISIYITEIYNCKLFLTISNKKKCFIIYNLIGILDKGKSLLEFDNMKIKIKENELYSKLLDYKKNINIIHIELYDYASSICALSSNTIAISLQDGNIEIYIINIITNTKEKEKIEYFRYLSLKYNIFNPSILNLKSTTIDNFLMINKVNYNKLNKNNKKEKTIPIYLFHIFNYCVVIRDGFSFQIIKTFFLKSGFSSNFLIRNFLYDEYNHILIILSLSLEDLKSYITCYSFEGIILSSFSSHIGLIEMSPYSKSSILQYNYINETIEELNALQLIKTSEILNKQPLFNIKVIDSTSHLFTTTFELFLKNEIEPKNENIIKLDDILKSIQVNSLKYSVVILVLSNGDVSLLNLK